MYDLEESEINSALSLQKESPSITQDDDFFNVMMNALTNDGQAKPNLLDPIYFTIMKDPVVVSSGVVMDRSTVLTPNGNLKFAVCPYTR